MFENIFIKNAKHIVVTDKRETLSDYVRRVSSEKGITYREIARRARSRISYTTVGDIINNPDKDVGLQTLQALAQGLGVPEDEIFAVARGKVLDNSEYLQSKLYSIYQRMIVASPKTQDLISWLLIKIEEELEEDEQRAQRRAAG